MLRVSESGPNLQRPRTHVDHGNRTSLFVEGQDRGMFAEGGVTSVANSRDCFASLTVFAIFLQVPAPGVLELGENLILKFKTKRKFLALKAQKTRQQIQRTKFSPLNIMISMTIS